MNDEPADSKLRREPARVDLPRGQVRVLESHHASDFQMPLGNWPFHKLCWVAIGRGHLETDTDTDTVEIGTNDFLILPAGWNHRFVDDPGKPLTLMILCLSDSYLNDGRHYGLPQLWRETCQNTPMAKPNQAKTAFYRIGLINLFRQALYEQEKRQRGWECALQLIASQVILSLSRGFCSPGHREESSSLRAVQGAIEHIDTHAYQSFQISDLADHCDLSPRRFTDLFKKLTGTTFNEYHNRKRIEYACRRLKETGHILYACYESGFNDVAYFYRVFKKISGQTPGDYMKQNKLRIK